MRSSTARSRACEKNTKDGLRIFYPPLYHTKPSWLAQWPGRHSSPGILSPSSHFSHSHKSKCRTGSPSPCPTMAFECRKRVQVSQGSQYCMAQSSSISSSSIASWSFTCLTLTCRKVRQYSISHCSMPRTQHHSHSVHCSMPRTHTHSIHTNIGDTLAYLYEKCVRRKQYTTRNQNDHVLWR